MGSVLACGMRGLLHSVYGSVWQDISSGIPPGLGPLLFRAYINDFVVDILARAAS